MRKSLGTRAIQDRTERKHCLQPKWQSTSKGELFVEGLQVDPDEMSDLICKGCKSVMISDTWSINGRRQSSFQNLKKRRSITPEKLPASNVAIESLESN